LWARLGTQDDLPVTGDWDADGLQQRTSTAWRSFVDDVGDPRAPWLRIVSGRGREAVEATYGALLAGTVAAEEGRVLAL
jgi:hypothetical protein